MEQNERELYERIQKILDLANSSPSIINPKRLDDFKKLYKYAIKIAAKCGAKVSYKIGENYSYMSEINIISSPHKEITVEDGKKFAEMALLASNFSVYSTTDDRTHMDFGFVDMTIPGGIS